LLLRLECCRPEAQAERVEVWRWPMPTMQAGDVLVRHQPTDTATISEPAEDSIAQRKGSGRSQNCLDLGDTL